MRDYLKIGDMIQYYSFALGEHIGIVTSDGERVRSDDKIFVYNVNWLIGQRGKDGFNYILYSPHDKDIKVIA